MLRLGRLMLFPMLLIGIFLISPAHPLAASAASLSSHYGGRRAVTERSISSIAMPPVAKKVRHEMKMFGDVREDDYYWLGDYSRSNPEILSYLKAENNYTDKIMSSVQQFEDQLYIEISTRSNDEDISVPTRSGPYYYYDRTPKGKKYVLHCRRLVINDTAATVYDVMPTGQGASEEHVVLDENIKAQGHDYYKIEAFKVSPDNKLIAYAEKTNVSGNYTIYIIDADKGTAIGTPLIGVTSAIEWAGNDTVVYITEDKAGRYDKVWSHGLLSEQSSDQCLYHEKDDMFEIDLRALKSKKYIFVESYAPNLQTKFILYLDICKQKDGLMTLTPRVHGIYMRASHSGNYFFILRRSKELYNFELVASPVDNPFETKVLIPNRERVVIEDFELFSGHLAIYERVNGLQQVTIYKLPPTGEQLRPLQNGRRVDFVDPIYSVYREISQFSSSILRFYYISMKTPPSIYDYDMNLGISVLKKIQQVFGDFKSSDYLTERK